MFCYTSYLKNRGKKAKNRLLDAGWLTNSPRFKGARPHQVFQRVPFDQNFQKFGFKFELNRKFRKFVAKISNDLPDGLTAQSTVPALQRIDAFESCSSLIFFSGLNFTTAKVAYQLRWSIISSYLSPQFNYMISHVFTVKYVYYQTMEHIDCSQPSIFSYFNSIVERSDRIARELYASAKRNPTPA